MYDVVIIGGGLVGSSLACALEPLGLRVALVEASAGAGTQPSRPPSFDERNLALSAASLNALDALGVLAHLDSTPAPIRRVHVTRRGDFGAVRLDAREHGRDAFGGVVVARELGQALESRLDALEGFSRHRPARLVEVAAHEDRIDLRVEPAEAGRGDPAGEWLQARLLVAADGTDSAVRDRVAIGAQHHDYRQTLFVSSIASATPHDGTAWERFTDSGPMALLPRPDGHFGAIMGVADEQADAIAALDDAAYVRFFQARFGSRAGRLLRAGRRSRYPIRRCVADALVAARTVLVGNAAQTLHPIGAQGFNLGLRDALSLAELLARPAAAADPGAPSLLAGYPGLREEDRARTLAFADGLAHATANPGLGMHALRSLGMAALERLPALKAGIATGAMGFRGRTPALSRGRGTTAPDPQP